MPRAASRVGLLGTETALDVLVKARAVEARGRQVIHLEVGEPDFPTPGHIVEAGVRALRDGYTRYGPPAGSPGLREAIAEHLAQRGVRANPEHVLVTPGAKPNLFYGFLATLSPGDEALVPDPGFPIYASMVRFCGATPVPFPPRLDQGRALDLDVLERAITPRTRMVVFNSPSNPTGAVVPEADLRRLAALADRHDLWVMADEIYRRIRYGADAPSIAALPGMLERTILVDGFSKAYAMTGWRLGWGLFPPALAPHAVRLVINSNTCTASFVQEAGIAALRGPQDVVEAMVARFRTRRDAIVARLARIPGVRCHEPAGAFYAFPDVRALPLSAAALADRLLQEEAVALLDGAGFGPGGAGYLRLSFASSLENLEEAADRFSSLVARL
ncbi:MAG: pyridoxal phosphate-dependent aminotransferase [Deltaproteobacteria bacterium]|nr:MAG: pyridoxal phosphate-dependent aminotransferase [Deltaproteobacteria bacterium]